MLENRHIRLAISLTRGAEFLELRDKATDEDLLWHGHPAITSNAGGTPSTHRHEGNFLDHFAGGWQEIFPSGGDPSTYLGADFGQHGEVALLPWTATILQDTAELIQVRFEVTSRLMPITLARTITLGCEQTGIHLDEIATNHSDIELPVMWGHHISIGGPWAVAANRITVPDLTPIQVPVCEWPQYRWAPGAHTWPHVTKTDGAVEDVRTLPVSDRSEGHLILGPMTEGRILLEAPALSRTVTFEWPVGDYPYAWCWFVYNGHPSWPLWGRHRLITIEPFTSPLLPLATAARTGKARIVPASGSITATVAVTFGSINEENIYDFSH